MTPPEDYDWAYDPVERNYPLTFWESRLIYQALRYGPGANDDTRALAEKFIAINLKHEEAMHED